jgi:DNA-binding transcriptional ArsR family regulator
MSKPQPDDDANEARRLLHQIRLTPERMAARRPRAARVMEAEAFFHVSEATAVAGAKALGCQRMLVWLTLCRAARIHGNGWRPLTTFALAEFGVSRDAKARALYDLEKAGLVEVERRERRNPMVRLVAPNA